MKKFSDFWGTGGILLRVPAVAEMAGTVFWADDDCCCFSHGGLAKLPIDRHSPSVETAPKESCS